MKRRVLLLMALSVLLLSGCAVSGHPSQHDAGLSHYYNL